MTDKKTPEEDIKRFESFIDEMSDTEYDYWYKQEATSRQKTLADQVREEIDDDITDSYMNIHRDSLRQFYGVILK